MKVLLIDANPKTADYSHSKWAAKQYVNQLQAEGHEVDTWSIYQMDIPVIDEDVMNAFGKMMNQKPLTQAEERKISVRNKLLEDFMTYDHYVVVSPLWNFGIPPQLKALVDVVAIAGKTFRYTENGPLGLLEGSFVHIQASGGAYSQMPEIEFGNRYISHVFAFLGLTEKDSLLIEGTNTGTFDRETFQPSLDEWVKDSLKEVM